MLAQKAGAKIRARGEPLIVLTAEGEPLAMRLVSKGVGLGSLELRLIKELLKGPAMPADLSRSLNTWHHHVARALCNLERKGLVKHHGFIGENLDRSLLVRKFYALKSEAVYVAMPVPKVDVEALRQEAADAQDRGMLLETFYQASARFGSHNAIKHYMGREQLLRLKAMVEQRLQGYGLS